MLTTAIRVLILFVCTRLIWLLLCRFVVRTDIDNIPGPPSHSFWKGNFFRLFNVHGWEYHRHLAENYGKVVRINALFGDKQLYVYDPKALHHIVVKDQYIYEETSGFIASNSILIGKGLLSTLGDHHRRQRKMLNPVFSIAHMREMIPIFNDVAQQLQNAIRQKVSKGPQEIDMLRWMTRTALELIGQSGLGYSFDNLSDDVDAHPYSVSVKEFVPVSFKFILLRTYFLSTLIKLGSPRFRRFLVNLIPFKAARQLRDIVDIIHNTSIQIFESKKTALIQGDEAVIKQVGRGKDIMSILITANMAATADDRLPEEEVLGQMSTLTFAAMDTTSNALSRTLQLLATHPDVQEKLRVEILDARATCGRDLLYDELVSLPYLDAICRETLRLYPPVSIASRTTRKDVVLPLSEPIKGLDGREMHEIAIPNNTNVIISILAANRDPSLWGADSYEWKPERWLSPLPDSIVNAHMPGIYSNLMTFLGGGRACIGFKFSQLEMKVVLSVLLSQFRFELSDQEVIWHMSAISSPKVKGSEQSQMPLKVSLVN